MPGPIKVSIIGCGAMGTALLEGWLRNRDDLEFYLHARTEESLLALRRAVENFPRNDMIKGFASSPSYSAKEADVIILACPPNAVESLLKDDDLYSCVQKKPTVSVLAGVSYENFKRIAAGRGDDQLETITRALPTLAARIGESVTMIAEGAGRLPRSDGLISDLFRSVGTVESVPEALMNEATALGAVCHALTITACDTMADASAAEGLPRPLALRLAASFIRGGSALLTTGGMTPEEVKGSMAIARGITINAVLDLDKEVRSGVATTTRNAIVYTRKMA